MREDLGFGGERRIRTLDLLKAFFMKSQKIKKYIEFYKLIKRKT